MHHHLAPPRLSTSSTNADDLSSSSGAFPREEYPTSASKLAGTVFTASYLEAILDGTPRRPGFTQLR